MTSGTAPAGTLRLLQGVSYPLPRGSLEDHLARWGPTPGWQDPGRQPWRARRARTNRLRPQD